MWLGRAAEAVEKGITGIARILNSTAAVLLVGLMALTVAEVIGRYTFNHPIKGSYELIEHIMGITVTLVMAYVMVKGAHIRIEVLTSRFPHRYQAGLEAFAYFLGMVTFGVVTWKMFLLEEEWRVIAHATDTLQMHIAPFVLVATIGWGIFALVCLIKLIHVIAGESKK